VIKSQTTYIISTWVSHNARLLEDRTFTCEMFIAAAYFMLAQPEPNCPALFLTMYQGRRRTVRWTATNAVEPIAPVSRQTLFTGLALTIVEYGGFL
jgi:hypothetical protein